MRTCRGEAKARRARTAAEVAWAMPDAPVNVLHGAGDAVSRVIIHSVDARRMTGGGAEHSERARNRLPKQDDIHRGQPPCDARHEGSLH